MVVTAWLITSTQKGAANAARYAVKIGGLRWIPVSSRALAWRSPWDCGGCWR